MHYLVLNRMDTGAPAGAPSGCDCGLTEACSFCSACSTAGRAGAACTAAAAIPAGGAPPFAIDVATG